MFFFSKLNIHVTDHVIGQIVTDVQALNLAVLAQFLEQILVKILEVILDLAGVKGLALRVNAGSDHVGALVHVGEEECGADAGLRVKPRASIAVPARADLKIERTVYSVLFGSEY